MKKMILGLVSTMMILGSLTANAQGYRYSRDRYDRPREYRVDKHWKHYNKHHGPKHRDYRWERRRPMPPPPHRTVVVRTVAVPPPCPPPPPRRYYRRSSNGAAVATAMATGVILGSVITSATR